MAKVYVTRKIPELAIQMLKEKFDVKVWEGELPVPREILLKEVEDIDGLLPLLTEKIDSEVIETAKKLKIVSNYAVGYDNIDIKAATEHGIMVTNTPGVLTETTADLAFALLMSCARRIVESDKYVREGKWKTWGPQLFLGRDIYGATLGLVGAGRIGTAVAKRAAGFNMKILYYSRSRKPELEEEFGAKQVSFDQLLEQSDFISIHVPLTAETKHLFNKSAFEKMKKTAILINTARGPVVDESALYYALANGEIAYAGLDVTDPEPIEMNNPLLNLDNVIVVPHIGSASIATRTKMATMAAENMIAGLEGKVPPNLVNREVIG
jgi:glyoxylate reductase